jgi:hypothetical protein
MVIVGEGKDWGPQGFERPHLLLTVMTKLDSNRSTGAEHLPEKDICRD